MNEKDKALARVTIAQHSSTGFLGFLGQAPLDELVDLVATAFAAVRQEVRAAAFKEAMLITQTTNAQYKNQSSLREAIVDRLEAAANSVDSKKEETPCG